MNRNLYLALGDSITAGYGASHPSHCFVRYVSDYIKAKSIAERTMVIAQNGWTSKDVQIAANLIHPSIWDRVEVLTLVAGGNDLRSLLRRMYLPVGGYPLSKQIVHQKLQEFSYHMNLLSESIAAHHTPHVIVTTVYNPAPNFPLAVYAIESLNHRILDIAKSHSFEVVDIYTAFQNHEASYIEGYRSGRFEDLATPFRRPIHPNNAGHQQIANLLMQQLDLIADRSQKRMKSKGRL